MWHLALLLIIGAALADHDHAWEAGNEYHFHVHSRTLTNLGELTQESTGILMKGSLIIQATASDTLHAVISKPRYARVHQKLPHGWTSRIPAETLEYLELPMSGKPFEIKMKHGIIRDLLIEKDVPTWEVNLLKSIMSQLQVDTQGENKIRTKHMQVPINDQPYAMFRAMEDSVAGKCEVLYDIIPLSESALYDNPELVPLPHLRGEGQYFDISKTKNHSRCEQRMIYHFGVGAKTKWQPVNENGYIMRTSTSRVIISGSLKQFTIQSSVAINEILINQKLYNSVVHSGVNVTLDKVNKISNPLHVSDHLVSTGNLVYTYNSPFSEIEKHKASPNIARNSLPALSSESSQSSSEERQGWQGAKDPQDSSSESAANSIADSDERGYLHSKPSLDQAPDNPLLPYFIGYKGKTIHKAEEVDVVETSALLIKELPEDIDSTQIRGISPGLLEKFTILCRLIRTMNSKQIAELEDKVAKIAESKNSNDELKKQYDHYHWSVLRDAVAHAGTGPAFVTIKNWIKEKKLKDMEAARIVSKLPKTARMPTTEYIQAFFELITQPEVMHQKFLNVTAPLAFAELVFYTQVNNIHHHNRYPIFIFGRMTPKEDQAVVETYIPYIAKQLKEAIKEGDSTRIQTYIMALGNFGHPKMLSILEPYLEGTVPVSTFQRTMMIISLSKLAENHPRLARSVAYKTYLNVREANDVRSAAVFAVLKTNPPLATLQRMAQFTKRDDSKQVNSAVKFGLENLAEMEGSEWNDLANKARIAKQLLTSEEYDDSYSRILFKKFSWENIAYDMAMYIIGSDDSDVPKFERLIMDFHYGLFHLPRLEMGYMVSSVKQLLNIWNTLEDDDEEQKSSAVEKIAHALGIHPEDPQQLEGNLLFGSLYESQFYPFDNHTIERFVEMMTKNFIKTMKPGLFQFSNINHLDTYDITIGCPTESGLPFVYMLEAPRLIRFSGEGKLSTKPLESFTTNLNVAGHLIIADSVQNRVGFLTPFDHHQYIAGNDQNTQMFLPFGFEVKFEPMQKSIDLTIHPDNYYRYGLDMIMLSASNIPYTACYDILKLQPMLWQETTHYAYNKKPQNLEFNIMDNIRIHISSDFIETESGNKRSSTHDIWDNFVGENAYFKTIGVILKSLPGHVHVNFDVVETDADSEADDETWPALPVMADKQPNSEARRQQFLQEVSKGINSATNYIFDINAYIPTVLRDPQIFTIGLSESNVDEKSRALVYWKQDPKEPDSDENAELCMAGLMRSSHNILLDPEKAIKHIPKDEFNIKFQLGTTCEDGLKINIEGNQTRSPEFKEAMLESDISNKCRHEMMEGNKGLQGCQEAVALFNLKDHLMLSIDIESEILNDIIHSAVQFASQNLISDENIEVTKRKNTGKKTIDLEMKLSPDFENAKTTLHLPEMDVTFDMLDLSDSSSSLEDKITDMFEEEEDTELTCTLDKTKAKTFDDWVYPVHLGKCWHVMMTTYPQKNPDNPDESLPIPEEIQVAVLVKETDGGHKQVRMIMGDKEIEMHKSGDHLEAMLNGEKVQCSQHKSHRVKENDETVLEIFRLPDESIMILSEEHGVNAVYDGERIRLEVSEEYRNAIRGLCGNYDTQPDNDFTTPKNCVLRKPEEFIATYAMTQESCEGPAVKNKQKAEHSVCIRMQDHQSNVISDREAGRPWTENKKWGYHHDNQNSQEKHCTYYRTKIMEEDDHICFTTRPLRTCAENCKGIEMKTKKYSLHCMPKTESSLQLKKRIEQGANPNMIHRSISKSHSYEVPFRCVSV